MADRFIVDSFLAYVLTYPQQADRPPNSMKEPLVNYITISGGSTKILQKNI